MQPPVPVGRVTDPIPGELRRQQRHPGQRRERQVILAPGRAGGVPVDEADQVAVGPYGVPRRRIQMTDQKSRLPRPAGEPDGVLRPAGTSWSCRAAGEATHRPAGAHRRSATTPAMARSHPRSGRAGMSGVRAPGRRSRGRAARRRSRRLQDAAAPRARSPSTAARGGGLRRRRVRLRNCARRAAVVRSSPGSTAIRRPRRPNKSAPSTSNPGSRRISDWNLG